VDTAAKEKTELEMFYLRNVSINPLDMFPKDISDKFVPTSLVRGRSVTMPLVTLFILRAVTAQEGNSFGNC
jgi:hypothetical protein